MNSKEFIQACEDGKTLVWGEKGLRIMKRSCNGKKFFYLDVVTEFSFCFDRVEMGGENAAFMLIGENPVGVIPTKDWDILPKKEVKE